PVPISSLFPYTTLFRSRSTGPGGGGRTWPPPPRTRLLRPAPGTPPHGVTPGWPARRHRDGGHAHPAGRCRRRGGRCENPSRPASGRAPTLTGRDGCGRGRADDLTPLSLRAIQRVGGGLGKEVRRDLDLHVHRPVIEIAVQADCSPQQVHTVVTLVIGE